MRIALFSSKSYDVSFFDSANVRFGHRLTYLEGRLSLSTALLAKDHDAVCAFVNDLLDEPVLIQLQSLGVRYLLLRSAGYNHLDRSAATQLQLKTAYVPHYSPYAVAEHALALILALNRKTHRAFARVREGNFSIEGLMGFDLHGRTAGIVGLGKIGLIVARILRGFGCEVIAFDPYSSASVEGITSLPFRQVLARSDILSLHCPLTNESHHLLNAETLSCCRRGMMLINTSRGGLIDTASVIAALESGLIGSLGIDVYENEGTYFYEDFSHRQIQDDLLTRLIRFPNVLVTSHQGFFTSDALTTIAETTLKSATDFEAGRIPADSLL